ncbi:hypothetical protein FB561_3178 [Kribbella amoyensis]|uniref:Uncharacterized protein n=1 Tax=Kribbella amoyensis TaxID=996641 RepID=A0A561BTA7_9ACTN|nr:hypothetical protein [Kribbella amoyensis]TWD82052.1 hypothetical protein FB561_3178 [Kribbella amoyensis]
MTVADRISRWLAELRASGQASLLARTVIAVAGAIALLVPAIQPWDELDLVPVLGIPLLVACVVLPDSAAALAFLVVVAGGWVIRAPADIGVGVVVTAIALVAVHLASAFAGQIPSFGRVGRGALRRWLLPASIAIGLAPVVGIGAALVRGADVPGSLLVTVAALAAATVAIWFAAGQTLSGRD